MQSTSLSLVFLAIFTGRCWGQGEDGAFSCPRPNGQFATFENCRNFYQCVEGVSYKQKCAGSTFYDGSRHQCVHKSPALKCGPQPKEEKLAENKEPDPYAATKCDPINCVLPYCHCSEHGRKIPGNLLPRDTPQMIMLTFDGAINNLNYRLYTDVFLPNRTNPNGCEIRGTFFVSHDYTNYALVEDLYSQGHEIAAGSISRSHGLEDADEEVWTGEIVSMREILMNFAGVREADIKGQRGPHLKPGREAQYEVLSNFGFKWDSTINNPPTKVPVWPYSLEYKIPHECRSGTCPNRSFPGVFEIPMNSHYKDTTYPGSFCPYLDQCSFSYFDEDEVLEWLKADFTRHYNSNRAPYMMAVSTNWFQTKNTKNAYHRFIDYTMTLDDVYYVTMSEAVQWVTTPQPLQDLQRFAPWDCSQKVLPPPPCTSPESCQLILDPKFDQNNSTYGTRYMVTCRQCPQVYPWMWDASGLGLDSRDFYDSLAGNSATLL